MLLILQPPPGELDQLAPQPVAQRPKLLVTDERPVPHARPKLRLGQFLRPVRRRFHLAKLAPPEFSYRPFHPAGQVDAVGHVADRHFVHRRLRIKAVPHLAADLPVQLAHAVGRARRLEREHGHAKFLVVVVRIHPAKREQLLGADVELPVQVPHRVIHQLMAKTIVTGRHRRVSREQALPPCPGQRLVKTGTPAICSRINSSARNAAWPSFM